MLPAFSFFNTAWVKMLLKLLVRIFLVVISDERVHAVFGC